MIILNLSENIKYRGSALVMVMILLVVCSMLAVSMAAMSGTNIQIASNQHKVGSALSAAQSGLECGKFLISTLKFTKTNRNAITRKQANLAWNSLCTRLQLLTLDGRYVSPSSRFYDSEGNGEEIITEPLDFDETGESFTLRFYRYDNDPNTIKCQSIGTCGDTKQQIKMDFIITKEGKVLNYAIASRGRMWLTGETMIHGDILSTWSRPDVSPYYMTSDSAVYGTINTALSLDQLEHQSYKLESLGSGNEPMDKSMAPLSNNFKDRFYDTNVKINAYYEGIRYNQKNSEMPGMKISDYNTDIYNSGLAEIEECPAAEREIEYFPHSAGNYNSPRDGTAGTTWNRKLKRHVYENKTFSNTRLPGNRNALFRNCTFENVLYIDCNKNAINYFNNIRFENCTFNGIIVTNVPQSFKWEYNCLYFTGGATFRNRSVFQEASILAPNFNVNLGNTNPEYQENNILKGAIVGGIVDIRGNAQIRGTIISMCDTSQWLSGYVTNIGATLDDGGEESIRLDENGIINITPDQNKLLPNGISTPIIIKSMQSTYSEG